MKSVKNCMLAAMIAGVVCAGTVMPNGSELVIDVPQGETFAYAATVDASVTLLRKTGKGVLDLNGANNPAFTGSIYIEEGTIKGDHGYDGVSCSFGSPAEVHIADGGCWYIDSKYKPADVEAWEGANAVNQAAGGNGKRQVATPLCNTAVFVSGAGADGNGAICVNSTISDHNIFGHVKLLGPTMFYVGYRWGLGGTKSSLDCGGYDLTIKGSDSGKQFEFGRRKLTWTNPGNIYVENTAVLFEGGSNVMADNSQTLTERTIFLSPGSRVRVFNGAHVPFKLHYNVKVGEYAMLLIGNGNAAYIDNTITGDGGTLKIESGGGTYTKATDVKICKGISGLSVETVNNGKFDPINAPYVIEGPATNSIADLNACNGKLMFKNGTTNTIGMIWANGASNVLSFVDAGYVLVTNKSEVDFASYVPKPSFLPFRVGLQTGSEGPLLTRMVVAGKTVIAAAEPRAANELQSLYVGIANNGSYARGILDVRDGAVMTNGLFMGNAYSTQIGALYLSGKDTRMVVPGGKNSMSWIGRGSCYAAVEMADGTFESDGWLTIGQSGRGFFVQRGGEVKIGTDHLKIGRESMCYAQYCALGGTYESRGNSVVRLGFCDSFIDSSGYTAVFSVDGRLGTAPTASVCQITGYIATNKTSSTRGIAMVNINHGGTLRCQRIYRESVLGSFSEAISKGDAVSPLYVNFDGGVLVPSISGAFFNNNDDTADSATRQPTRVTVYGGGATVDTEGRNVVMSAPFEKPYGKGVAGVTLTDPESLTAEKSIGTRRVRIDGNGMAADVITDFNPEGRINAAEALVISPGFGYNDSATAGVEAYKVYSLVSNATVRLVDFDEQSYKHGGFTKRGAGTLTLEGANTYGGTTRVEGGTLAFANAHGYPGGDLEFPSGAVTNAAAPLVTAQSLAFNAGAKIRVTGADLLNDKCCNKFVTIATSAEPIENMPAVEWVDDDGEPVAMNSSWSLRATAGGTRIEFGYQRGTIMIIR